jgi:diguanylate cyclase (GGDEF)-like protein
VDTHAGQEAALNNALQGLGTGLKTLRETLGAEEWRRTRVLVMSEFGRTARENGTRGTDHGHGGLALVAGGGLAGGRMLGDFPGLVEKDLHEGRDLPNGILNQAQSLAAETKRMDSGGMAFLLVNLALPELTPNRVLVLWRATWNETDTRLVLGMVRVYMNFTRLLFDSEKDTLTGLFNRKRLERRLAEISSAHLKHRRQEDRNDRGEYLALLDLDRFKRINDEYGHLIGDEVLIIFAHILRDSLRDKDMCFRYGGEEFLILLQDVTPEHARTALERIRHNVESHAFPQVGRVTVSIGFSAVDCRAQPAGLTIAEADRALYYAKEQGRNQVRDYQALVATGLLEPLRKNGSMELF